jgi:hypothetical protein
MISVDPKTVGDVWVQFYDLEATPTMSYFVSCAQLPSTIAFGVPNGGVAYQVVGEGDVFKHYISKLGRHDD